MSGVLVQVRPPKDAQPMPLPDAWGPAVRCHLREVRPLACHHVPAVLARALLTSLQSYQPLP